MRRFFIFLSIIPTLLFGQDSLNVTRVGGIETTLSQISGLALHDTLAFITAGFAGLGIYCVGNPANPYEVSHLETGGHVKDVDVAGNFAYIVDYPSGLHVVDISNPSEPQIVGNIQLCESVQRIAVSNGMAYVTCVHDGLVVVDVSDPELPVELGRFDNDHTAFDVAVSGNLAYVAFRYALSIIDISDLTAPVELGSVFLSGTLNRIAVSGNYVIVSVEDYGIQIIDVSNPSDPQQADNIDFYVGSQFGVATSGTNVFHANVLDGLTVYDFSTPPDLLSTGYYRNFDHSAVYPIVAGELVYVAQVGYLGIYDVSAALGAPEHHNEIPTQFSLHLIYPNPFNNTANISFDLPREVTGRLVVYDVLGRMTNTLYDGKLSAGSHQMQFNGNSLSSGTYFVKLETPDFNAIQKAVLLK